MIKLLQGDCRDLLPTLADDSVHMVCTSPPYYNLRDYQTGTWEGGDDTCDHAVKPAKRGKAEYTNGQGGSFASNLQTWGDRDVSSVYRDTCGKCGARRIDRQIGLEATPEDYLATMVAVFREVRRILRDDGCIFLNCGDAYTNKQLQMMPARLAIALQADGWFLRSMMPWLKRSAMPESVTDRPASAVEYVFLFTKHSRYFWDAEAVKRGAINEGRVVSYNGTQKNTGHQNPTYPGAKPRDILVAPSRNLRNSDLFYDSLEDAPEPAAALPDIERYQHLNPRGAEGARAKRRAFEAGATYPLPNNEPLGLICSDDGEPLALDVNPAAWAQAHFATFPPKLVEPLIRAGTSERGCCAACGAPWYRTAERSFVPTQDPAHPKGGIKGVDATNSWGDVPRGRIEATTTGWTPSCACDAAVVPCTVLDPFAGAGTTLLVADRLQRDAIGIELSQDYTAMGAARVVDDAPLLAWLAEAAQ